MATFTVTIREIVYNTSTIEIEAEDWEQAESLALEQFYAEGCKWEESSSNGLELDTEEE